MKIHLKPKYYDGELDNPFIGKDPTKEIFWKWERTVFTQSGDDGRLLKDYILRGMQLLSADTDGTEPDDIPDYIKDADAPLEERAFVAQIYSNELGIDLSLQKDPSQIDWVAYFKD